MRSSFHQHVAPLCPRYAGRVFRQMIPDFVERDEINIRTGWILRLLKPEEDHPLSVAGGGRAS